MKSDQLVDKEKLYFLYSTLLAVVILVMFSQLFFLQVRSNDRYTELARNNAQRIIPLIPPRGDIFDREGRLIATEQPAFSLYAIPALFNGKTYQELKKILPVDSAELWKKIGKIKHYQPVKIFRQISDSALIHILENEILFPGLDIRVEPRRRYLSEKFMSHVLGTLGEALEEEVNASGGEIEEGDIIGKKGIEKYYDEFLRGEKGYKFILVDVLGKVIEEDLPEKQVPPVPGKDLYLTIDSDLQERGEYLMEGKRGALVMMDVRNGEILALVSAPQYNLDLFTGTIRPEVWAKLISDTTYPLYDRVLQSTYPPGSTFKIITAIAALNEKIISPEWSVYCPGYFQLGRRTIRCWKKDGHGNVNLSEAIKQSCNVYFYQLGLKIGLETWNRYSQIFRFGSRTGIDIWGEKGGLIPSREYYEKVYGKNGWTKGNLANLAIGQGELLVTPLQMAQMAMIIANEGKYYRPHILLYAYDKVNNQKEYFPVEEKHISQNISSSIYAFIRQSMEKVVSEGTGRAASIPGFTVAGKTGTAQNPGGADHAWFFGFAPVENPRVAFCVLVENGGGGGAVAAPIAREMLELFKRKYYRNSEELAGVQ